MIFTQQRSPFYSSCEFLESFDLLLILESGFAFAASSICLLER